MDRDETEQLSMLVVVEASYAALALDFVSVVPGQLSDPTHQPTDYLDSRALFFRPKRAFLSEIQRNKVTS